jgi:hypothetical protein
MQLSFCYVKDFGSGYWPEVLVVRQKDASTQSALMSQSLSMSARSSSMSKPDNVPNNAVGLERLWRGGPAI